jgi:hypothetical protein
MKRLEQENVPKAPINKKSHEQNEHTHNTIHWYIEASKA